MLSRSLDPCTSVDEPITQPRKRRTAASYVGARFERLLILELVEQGRTSRVLCRCDCGQEKVIMLGNITAGLTRSCGCLPRIKGQSQKRPLRDSQEIPATACSDDRPHDAHTWRDPKRRWRDPAGRIFCDGVQS